MVQLIIKLFNAKLLYFSISVRQYIIKVKIISGQKLFHLPYILDLWKNKFLVHAGRSNPHGTNPNLSKKKSVTYLSEANF